jgi:hypothetical protein
LRDGGVVVLDRWAFDASGRFVSGDGVVYDSRRNVVNRGRQTVSLVDVELFETNDPERVTRAGVPIMAVATGASLLMTAFCIAEPKACFGSCPTFYVDDGTGLALQAEGFSSSIARSLESTDVDSMWTAVPKVELDVVMTNDALETHLVDSVRLLAVPRRDGHRTLRAGDTYWEAKSVMAPESCASELGDCLSAVREVDDRAYLSPADAHDLATKETLELGFARGSSPVGIEIAARNSLLNTFLFYQGLAYMGRSAGDFYVGLNHAPPRKGDALTTLGDLLGDIDVSVRGPDGEFHPVGRHAEVGPIAREVQLVLVPDELVPSKAARVDVRLTMTAGNFKLDQVALVELGARLEPSAVAPSLVLRHGQPDPRALAALTEPGAHLVTYPGDAYTLRFELPDTHVELYLESRGYYYEWIRESWLPEESPLELARLFMDPRGAMKRLAPEYKRLEGGMERIFWQSRVGHR